MVSFEIFVKAMPPSLSELKVLPSFCFTFKIPDDRAVTNDYNHILGSREIFTVFSVVFQASTDKKSGKKARKIPWDPEI